MLPSFFFFFLAKPSMLTLNTVSIVSIFYSGRLDNVNCHLLLKKKKYKMSDFELNVAKNKSKENREDNSNERR